MRAIIPDGMKKYKCETPPHQLTQKDIDEFIQNIFTGGIKPILKSDPIPADNNGPLVQVVGKTFDEIVMDPTKDVFVKFYAPWCGHCKSLAPAWEQLAEDMKGYDNLVVAKFDATTNEAIGVSIRSYPTIILYPKDFKEGLKYEGDRDLEMFKTYLKDVAPTVVEQDTKAQKDDL